MNVTTIPATPFLDASAAFTLVSLTGFWQVLTSEATACVNTLCHVSHLYLTGQCLMFAFVSAVTEDICMGCAQHAAPKPVQ